MKDSTLPYDSWLRFPKGYKFVSPLVAVVSDVLQLRGWPYPLVICPMLHVFLLNVHAALHCQDLTKQNREAGFGISHLLLVLHYNLSKQNGTRTQKGSRVSSDYYKLLLFTWSVK